MPPGESFPSPPAERTQAGDSAWLEGVARGLLAIPAGKARTERLRILGAALAEHPAAAEIRERIQDFWAHSSAVRLLAEAGLPDHPGLVREAFQRLVDRAVPHLDPASDLYAWVDRLEPSPDDARWVAELPAEVAAPWIQLLDPGPGALGEAALLLAHRAAGLGLSRELLRLQPERADLESPFARLPAAVSGWRQLGATPNSCLEDCQTELTRARARLDERGVSTELVFRMDLLEALLARIRTLVNFQSSEALSLAAELLAGTASQHRIRPLLRTGFRRLARKVVEHTGHSGEHYLARDRAEFRAMGWAAAGGGALTAITATLKVLISGLGLAPGLQGLGLSLNYAGSFLVMQFLHLSLASKQPAATAAALAGTLEDRDPSDTSFAAEVDLVAAISRGQVAATLGNLLLAIPAALLVETLWRSASGHSFLGTAKAAKTLAELHPFHSATLPFAAFTGFLLWVGSLAGGWAANWSAYRDLPEAVTHSPRVRRWLGARGAARFGQALEKHFVGFVICMVLGLLLGFLPMLLSFGGIPLEVRHVTLSAASVALAMGPGLAAGALPWANLGWAFLGVACIGLLNFGVSFALSLRLAIQARGLGDQDRLALGKAIFRAFRKQPTRFLWSAKAEGEEP